MNEPSSSWMNGFEALRRDPELTARRRSVRNPRGGIVLLLAGTFGKQALSDYRKQDLVGQLQFRRLANVMKIAEAAVQMLSLRRNRSTRGQSRAARSADTRETISRFRGAV